jgi:arylsulfatase B
MTLVPGRGFIARDRFFWLVVALAVWGSALTCTPDAMAAENILLIIADDYGVSSHGLYGYASSSAPTPNLDTLAAQGTVFNNAWVTPMCAPTRAAILTGRHGFRTGVGAPPTPINLDEYTVAQAIKTLGYSTGCFGKWHLSGSDNGEDDNPNLMGFDRFAGYMGATVGDYSNWSKVVDGVTNPCTNYSTTEITNDAIGWINQQGSQRWFCWLAYNAPHSPFHKPPNDLHSYDALPGTNSDINQNTVLYYEAMVEAMDTEIGRLFSSIDPNVLDNTNVVFIGDNGTPDQAVVPPAERGRAKTTLYQGGVWVPWIMKGPSIPQTDTRVTALVNAVDLFSTIIELAGGTPEAIVPAEVVLDSRSVMPLLTNPGSDRIRHFNMTEIFRRNPRNSDGKTIRNGEYKLIRFDNGSVEFYHLADDTWEHVNLLAETLNTTQQDNYDGLDTLLDQLLSGAPVDLPKPRTWFVVDTGQTAFYDNSGEVAQPDLGADFYGQDAHYAGHQPSYLDNGDGTITDLVTGLVWQKTPDLVNQSTFAEAFFNAYTLDLAGHTDWRLPSLKELYSLIDFRGHIWQTVEQSTPYIDTNYFDFAYGNVNAGDRIIDAQYWSSTPYVGTTMNNAKELQSIVDYTRAPDVQNAARVGPAIDPVFQVTNIGTPQDPDFPYFWSGTTHLDGPHNWGVYVAFGEAWGYMEQPPGSGNHRLLNVHGAGAQRSDPKDGDPTNWPNGNGPQGDVVRIFNYVRCVRDAVVTN